MAGEPAGAGVDAATMDLLPHVVPLGGNVWGASFRLMKMLPAHHILEIAVRTGQIGPDTVVVESTSGTFGLALAIKTALIRRRLVLVTDPAMDERLCRRVADLGAEVQMCSVPSALGEYQSVRLERLAQVRAQLPDAFWPQQYDNPLNPAAYEQVADHLAERIGPIDVLVGPVGSGGSMCGTAAGLRRHAPVQVVGVDTPGSILFGQPDRKRDLRGLGNSLIPGNLDHTAFDAVHWCPAALAYRQTRRLHRSHALFHGPTSGAALAVARWTAQQQPGARIVVMLPDQGDRYLDSVYDDRWLDHVAPDTDPSGAAVPRQVGLPGPDDDWTWMSWERRTLERVLAAKASAAETIPAG